MTTPFDEEVSRVGLEMIADLVADLSAGEAMADSLGRICARICEVAGFRFCGVLVPGAEWTQFRLAGGHGFPDTYVQRLTELFLVPSGDDLFASPTRQAADQRRTIINADVFGAPEFVPWRALALEFGYRAMVSVPLFAQGEVIGVLNGYAASGYADTAPLQAVETLATHAAIALHVGLLLEERRATIGTLEQANSELIRHRLMTERAADIHSTLTAAVLDGADRRAIVRDLSRLIDLPVTVTAPDGTVELSSPEPAPPPPAGAVVSVPIRLAAETLGHVVIARESPDELTLRAAEHAATVLALTEAQHRVAIATEERLRADLLSELLRANSEDLDALRDRARRSGVMVGTSAHRIAVLRLDPDRPVTDPPPAEEVRAHADVLAAETRRRTGWFTGVVGTDVVAIIPADPSGTDTVFLHVQAHSRARRPDLALSIGVGATAADVPDLPRSHREAQLCAQLGPRLGRPGQIIHRDDLGMLGLFIDARRPEELREHAERTLGPALAHDRAHGAALVPTLAAYLDAANDLEACARGLFVHPNTVKYRLRKLEELCGVRVRVPDDLVALRLATLILRLL